MVRILFNSSSSSAITSFITSFVCRVINNLKNELVEKKLLVEELEALNQVKSNFASWKARHLSFAGQVTLSKAIIEALPIYTMMTTCNP